MTEEVTEVETPVQDVETTDQQESAQIENQEDSVTSSSEESTPEGKSKTQRRIDEITWQKHSAERKAEASQRETDYWREQALKTQQPAQEAHTDGQTEPRQDDFDDYDEFVSAKIVYEAGKLFQQQQQQAEEVRTQEQQAQAKRSFAEKTQAFKESHPDFDAVAQNPDLPVTNEMAEVITSIDAGAEVLYELGNNPGEALRISQLPPLLQVRELALMEARITAKPTPKQSTAPDPITPLGGNQPPVSDPEKMPTDAWMAMRNKQVRGN